VATAGRHVEHSERGGDVAGVAAKIMVVDSPRSLSPGNAWILEESDEFFLLGVDGDHGEALVLESAPHVIDVDELTIALVTGVARAAREFLVVDTQSVVKTVEKPRHGPGADVDVEIAQFGADLACGFSRPLQPGDGIARGGGQHQLLDLGDDFGRFFSTALRPAPGRRRRSTRWSGLS